MKKHNDPEYLRQAIEGGKNSREIARELRVSWKLVEINLRRHGIKHTPYVREV